MEVKKGSGVLSGGTPGENDLGLIHALSKVELKAEEVYTFGVRLCDNEVDRDGERFTNETLGELAALFVGKSGIFDHQWKAEGQMARIYRTELVREDGVMTMAGEPYRYLKGYAYMLRSEKNNDLIAEIEAGIKKEVSVGCSVGQSICSICGNEMGACEHVKGRSYGGQKCWADLVGATDAYEWSFVAVPAQRNAGVMKTATVRQGGEMAQLEYEASLGRKYLAGLRDEVARLGKLVSPDVVDGIFGKVACKLEEDELLALKKGYEAKLDREFVGSAQLSYQGGIVQNGDLDGAFVI